MKSLSKVLFLLVGLVALGVGIFTDNTEILATIPVVNGRSIFTNSIVAYMDEKIQVKSFLRSFFRTTTSGTQSVSIEVRRGTEKVAVDVLRGTFGNRNTVSKSTLKMFVPPYYREYITISEMEVYHTAVASQDPAMIARVSQEAAEEMLKIRNKIERAYELQCSQALHTGVIELKNGDNIDFGRKAGSMVTVGTLWSSTSTADPIKDLEDGCKFLRNEGKMQSGTVNAIMGSDALNLLLDNDKFKARADIRRIDLDRIYPPEEMPTGSTFHGEVSAGSYNVRLWAYPEVYEDSTGTRKPYIKEDHVILIPVKPDFLLSYAAVPTLIKSGQNLNSNMLKGEYKMGEYIDERNTAHEMDIQSAAVAVPVAVDQIYTMKVK